MVDKVLVREYLSSLKEDGELDKILILLLESMGFQIIRTAKDTKGISQYGSDIIAIGKDKYDKEWLWQIEVKGHSQKDVNVNTFSGSDASFQSFIEALYTPIVIAGNSEINKLPRRFVLAHNGITDAKFQPTFNGIIEKHLPEKDEFEDWNIYKLSDLFSDHLFGSYIFTSNENERLFKRLIIFFTTPEYNFDELHSLFRNLKDQLKSNNKFNDRRKFVNFFATINLIMQMTWHYADEEGNLNPAKYVINYCILNTWAFILEEKKEKRKKFLDQFDSLLKTQFRFLSDYYRKTFEVASSYRGLFNSKEFNFEQIGYSIRCYEYCDYLTYFYQLNNAFIHDNQQVIQSLRAQKDSIRNLVGNNKEGFSKILFDDQLIAFHHFFSFMLSYNSSGDEITNEDAFFLIETLQLVFEQFLFTKKIKGSYIYSSKDLTKLIIREFKKSDDTNYPDKQSIMLPVLIEYLAIFNLEFLIENFKPLLEDISLQLVRPNFNLHPDIEVLMFMKNLDQENFVELIELEKLDARDIIESRRNATRDKYTFRTVKAGYSFLITLAQSFYKNEPYPEEWREWFDRINIRFES